MLRTLHTYIARDLLKITGLSLVAFTLVMTIFAIIEPLTQQGLAAEQLGALFLYTVPVMLSLTLPVAALFAATIVYGRFSQDNELMACRASGVATFTILKPAIYLGVAVTIAALVLSNFVAPIMVARGARSVQANLRSIAFRQLASGDVLQAGKLMIHADRVHPDTGMLEGVVAADTGREEDLRLLTARAAYVSFDSQGAETYVTVHLVNPVLFHTGSRYMVQLTSQELPSVALPNPAQEEPSWYDWNRLLATLRSPEKNAEIRSKLRDIRREIRHDLAVGAVAKAVRAGEPYARFTDAENETTYRIDAPTARLEKEGRLRLLSRPGAGGRPDRVEVTLLRDEQPFRRISADEGIVEANWSVRQRFDRTGAMSIREVGETDASTSFVTIELRGNVAVRHLDEGPSNPVWRGEWVSGQLPIPEEIRQRADAIELEDIYNQQGLPDIRSAGILKDIRRLKNRMVTELLGEIRAEMHGRVAYGLSCFLLVSLGAALGLMFRGGQIISAFAIMVVPAAVVIIMVIMGKQMVTNPDVSETAGLTVIWSGIVLLILGSAAVYAYVLRR